MKRCRATELNLFRGTQAVNPRQKRYGGKSLHRNPAVENQATDHAFCIGQKQTVNVCRLISAETFEEKINAMAEVKKTLADMTVESGENWIGDLTNNELKEIFTRQNH